jgi:hypothetical protein
MKTNPEELLTTEDTENTEGEWHGFPFAARLNSLPRNEKVLPFIKGKGALRRKYRKRS